MLAAKLCTLLVVEFFATVSCASANAPDFDYIVAPLNATPGESFAVYVHVEETTSKLPQTVSVSIVHSSNGVIATNGPRTILSGSYDAFQLEIPENAEPGVEQYTLEVSMITHAKTMVNRSLPFGIRGDNRIILIQTDKPIYKPGETVKGRVIILTRYMTSADGAVLVTIKNPKMYTMGKFADIELNAGVGLFEFPLSSEPVLGKYKCCATYKGLPRGQKSCFTFEVKRYVLPKFSCSITPVDEIVGCGTRKICFSVTANYTYGQSVKGRVRATVHPNNWYRCITGQETVTKQIDGRTDVCVKVCSRYRLCWGEITIDANVTDPTSDTTVQCEGQTAVPVRNRPYKLEILEEDSGFTPCHFTTVKVFASTLTGKPTYANVNLTGSVHKRNRKRCRSGSDSLGPFYQKTDNYGIATFHICMTCQALEVYFWAHAVDDSNDNLFTSAFTYRRMIWSSGRIALSTNAKQSQVGTTVNITASFSRGNKANYYVVSKGRIVARGNCTAERDLLTLAKHPQLCKRGNIRRTCNITIEVTSFMAPKFAVIVSQKNVATSRIIIDVIPDNSTRMSLGFQSEEVLPGGKANLTIRAPPKSFIGVVAVDKSVYFQQEKNQLTISKLYNEVSKFDGLKPLPSDYYICDWYLHCPCLCPWRYPGPTATLRQPLVGTRPTAVLPTLDDAEVARGIAQQNDTLGDIGGDRDLIFHDGCCPRNCTEPESVFDPQYCLYFKASSYFLASGIQVSDSDITPPVECPKPNPPTKHSQPKFPINCCAEVLEGGVRPPIPVAQIQTLNGDPGTNVDDILISRDDSVNPSRVRKNFPETWLWFDRTLGDNESSIVEKLTVPDTITSWVADAFAVSQTNAVTIARPATLTVFQPFFVTINLPYSVIRGEILDITVTLFNYLQDSTTAVVKLLVNDDDMRVVRGMHGDRILESLPLQVALPAGEGTSVKFSILPLRNGYLPVQVTARSEAAADSVIRYLLVEPEGVKEEYSLSALMCATDIATESSGSDFPGTMCVKQQFNVSLPLNFVPDSDSATMSVTANYMGQTINGLESLLRLPTGCGEQNMLNFAPAVYIARYLDTVGELTAEIREKSLHFMQTGYQREMTYQRADGSYSAFGDRDSCGSMWLTAFVVRSFGQADGLIGMSIDPKVQEEAIDFILGQQDSQDGSFPPVCKPIHKEMQGCSGGKCSLAAYVTLALLEAGVSPKTSNVSVALDYLSTNCIPTDCSSPYTLSLVAYTLLKGSRNVAANTALSLLKSCAVTNGDHTYWQYKKTPSCANYISGWSYYCRPLSCDVETTAYALLAFSSTGDVAYSLRIVRWLIEQRNPRGGFKSTQDTVVALQALSEYATLTVSGGCVSANVHLSALSLTQKVTVDSGNAMQVQTVQLPQIPTTLDIEVCGACCILATVGVKYNAPQPDETAAFDVTASAVKQKGDCYYEVEVCSRWIRNDSDSSNMAVTEITFFSGFLPIILELEELYRVQDCVIKRTDFEGRVLSIYLEEITKTKCCYTVTMKRDFVVKDLQGVPVITYNYYEPDQRGGTMLYPPEEC